MVFNESYRYRTVSKSHWLLRQKQRCHRTITMAVRWCWMNLPLATTAPVLRSSTRRRLTSNFKRFSIRCSLRPSLRRSVLISFSQTLGNCSLLCFYVHLVPEIETNRLAGTEQTNSKEAMITPNSYPLFFLFKFRNNLGTLSKTRQPLKKQWEVCIVEFDPIKFFYEWEFFFVYSLDIENDEMKRLEKLEKQ